MAKQILIVTILGLALLLASCATPTQPPVQGSEVNTPVPEAPQVPTPQTEAPSGVLGPVTLNVSGWTYDLEKVMQNLDVYKEWVATEADPPIEVNIEWSDSGFGAFDTHVTTTFSAGQCLHVMYSSDHWLAKWAEAGWVVPLEDVEPDVLDYIADIAPYSVQAMTYNGKLYGLPYYTDVMYFVYNTQMLEAAGISASPSTWDEVTEQSLTLIEAGITETPFMVGLTAGSWFDEAFYTLIYSNGGTLFDETYKPVFQTNSGPVYGAIEWLSAALNDHRIMPTSVLEMTAVDVQEAFKNGDAAFVIVPGYMMVEFNTPGISKVAGHAEVSMMPGTAQDTTGYSRMYLMGNCATNDPVTQQAAWHLIQFLGGRTTVDGHTDYHIAKRFAVENGLGFSINSLWDDPEVAATFSGMGDVSIMQAQKEKAYPKSGMSAPWFAEWISFVRGEAQRAILRQISTENLLSNIQAQWEDLRDEY